MIVVGNAKLRSLGNYLGRRLTAAFAFDLLVVTAYVFLGWKWLALPDVPLSILGGIIGLMAGFRNSSAYSRWWEARTIWGGVINHSRNFAREALSMILASEPDAVTEWEVEETKHRLVLLQIAYVHALRHHLRGTAPWLDLYGLLPEPSVEELRAATNVPLAIQRQMANILADCYQRNWLDSMRWASLDRTLSSLMDCEGASERIKNTPIPRLYDLFIRRFIEFFCLLLPLGMVSSLGLLTPIGSTCVAFIFLALDQIGRDLESPFENRPNDIPLTAMSRNVEINLRQMMGDRNVPEPVVPVNGILW